MESVPHPIIQGKKSVKKIKNINLINDLNLSAVAAMSANRVIGKNNRLLWHLPADLMHFKQLTIHKTIVMGQKTYLSLGRPLPHRRNVVLTRNLNFNAEGIEVAHSLDDIFLLASSTATPCMIIGGAEIYSQLIPYLSKIYLTIVHYEFEGDTFFPKLNEAEWQETSRVDHAADEKHAYAFSFLTLLRK